MRDKGVILLFTSHSQTLTSEKQSWLCATGKRNRLAQFRVHKIASGIRMFESVLFPQQFIRIDDGACDIMVRECYGTRSELAVGLFSSTQLKCPQTDRPDQPTK